MLIPLQDNVILQKVQEENKTRSGIILTAAPAATPVAQVLAIGPDASENLLKVGAHVLYRQEAVIPAHVNGSDYLIIGYKDIVAVVE